MIRWLLDHMATPPDWLFALGVELVVVGLAALTWVTIGRKGNVTIGPDPVPAPKRLSDATTVIFPALPIAPNYRRSDEDRSELDEYFPMADTVDLAPQLRAVAAYLRRTETVTTVTEVVITIPRPRHRREDLHTETIDITASVARAKAAKELTS